MPNFVNRRSAAALATGALLVSILAGCGTKGMPTGAVQAAQVQSEAQATQTLMQGFDKIHHAIFTMLDKDKNNAIDEYEAGPQLSLDDFKKADTDGDGSLTYAEFKNYAITHLFFFHDSAQSFTSRFRSQLGDVFSRLDKNGDRLLTNKEMSKAALKRLQLTFEYPRLNIKVKIKKISADMFKAADKTGDGKLGQAEFEDLYINMVLAALGDAGSTDAPSANPNGADPDPNAAPAPAEPAADPNAAPAPAAGGDAPPAPAAPAPAPAPKKGSKKKTK
jgi:Ca2+-binding EF-hand superfamily protein